MCPQSSYCLCSQCIIENDQLNFHPQEHIFLRIPKSAPPPAEQNEIQQVVVGGDESTSLDLKSLGLSVKLIKEMLRRENELRLSEQTLSRFKVEGHEMYVPITEAIQSQVCLEFGLSEEVGLTALRCADRLMPTSEDLAEIKEISFYRKYNRMRDGDVKEGDRVPSICFHYPFYSLDSQLVSFKDILSFPSAYSSDEQTSKNCFTEDIINIIFASSIS
jgi:hypothetical protein